jgi:hypothetical protein
MRKITVLFFVFVVNLSFGQLNPGDISIVGYHADTPGDKIDLVALTDIPGGEVVYITDNGWKSSGVFRTGEGVNEWTAPQNGVACGTIISFDINVPSVGTIVTSGSLNLAGGGDQVLIYQKDTNDAITFIYAMNNDGQSEWQTSATSANKSALPTGLTNGVDAVAITEVDNVYYTGTLSGTKTELLSNISDPANWLGGNNANNSGYYYTRGNLTVSECTTLSIDSNTSKQLILSVSNGVVTATRGTLIAIYNTLGQKVSNNNLQGVYIVHIEEGAYVKAVKVLVN